MRSRGGSATGLLAWLSTLAVGLWLFHTMGDGGLAAPPMQPAAFVDWLGATEPLLATMAVLRVVVLGLAWYLVGVTTIGMLARLTRAARLVRLADAVTVPAVRRLLQSALGVGLATAMVGAATPARAEPLPLQVLETAADPVSPASASDVATAAPDADATDAVVDDRAPGEGSDGPSPGAAAAATDDGSGADDLPLVLRLLDQAQTDAATADPNRADPAPTDAADTEAQDAVTDDRDGDARDTAPGTAGNPAGGGAAAADAASDGEAGEAGHAGDEAEDTAADDATGPATTGGREHRVVAGDSFWSIAVAHLTDTDGVAPTDAEVVPYWQRLVDDNRDRLADPQNPDLLFPGQVVVLPDAMTTG